MFSRSAYRFGTESRELDRGVVFGIGGAVMLILAGIALDGNIANFLDPISLIIVLGGTFGATFANFSMYDLRQAWGAFRSVFFSRVYHPIERINYMLALSQRVKRNGLLVLEGESRGSEDSFLKLALDMTVDAQPAADVRRILETEMRVSNERAMRAVQVFETLANYAPAMGLIGTLIGLINMLGVLTDPARVGPSMALALVTTFYGAILANLVFLPIAGRLRNRTEEANTVKAITIEGAISLGKQESPLLLEQKLQSFLPLTQAA